LDGIDTEASIKIIEFNHGNFIGFSQPTYSAHQNAPFASLKLKHYLGANEAASVTVRTIEDNYHERI